MSRPYIVRLAVRVVPALFLLACSTLYIPGPATLELYEAEDLTYGMGGGFPGVDISLAQDDSPGCYQVTGMELAQWLGWLVPDGPGDRGVDFSNGLVIVRASGPQHAAIWTFLQAWRLRTRSLEILDATAHRLKRAWTPANRP